jgi:hypothetical protein
VPLKFELRDNDTDIYAVGSFWIVAVICDVGDEKGQWLRMNDGYLFPEDLIALAEFFEKVRTE